MVSDPLRPAHDQPLPDYGEMAGVMAAVDWAGSPLGAPDRWSPLLAATLRFMLPAQAQIVLFWGPDYVALYNDAYAPTIGHKHPHAFGRPACEHWTELWDDLEPMLRAVRERGRTIAARDRPFRIDRRGFLEDVYFDISYSPVTEADGAVAGVLCIVTDTTERIRESRALEVLNGTAQRIAAELETDRLIQAVVEAGTELTGAAYGAFFYNAVDRSGETRTLHALAGADAQAFADFSMPRITALFGPTFAGSGIVRSDDITHDPRYGRNHPHFGMPKGDLPLRSYLAVPVISRSNDVIGGLFFGHPDTARFDARAERLAASLAAQAATGIDNARLLEATRRLNATLEAQVAARTAERDRIWQVSRDLLGVADLAGVWQSINPAWTNVLGWEANEIVGRTVDWLLHPEDVAGTHAEIARLLGGEPVESFENRLRTRDGRYRALAWTAVPVEGLLYTVARDVTEERERARALVETEAQLRQAQKMEIVGHLTGGIAHDFNNLLQIVTGNLETVQRSAPDDAARLRRAADNAMQGAQRAATLTQRLLAFSRRQPLSPKPVDVNALIRAMSDLLRRTLGETVTVATDLAADAWLIEADPNQLESAILNLAINARDAMPQGGRLTITAGNATIADAGSVESGEIAAGDYLRIEITDTGIGMDAATLERVFEPFFTTKDVGKGTGLGLSMVYGFVRQSGGHVAIRSQPGLGTTISILLPRLDAVVVSQDEQGSGEPAAVAVARPGETILVCEDDDDVRAHSVESLRELGYRVFEAGDGPATLKLLEREGEEIDLLFTDVVLSGGMTGAMVAQQARALWPRLRILFTTGYARDTIVHHGRLDPGIALITKPFTFAGLATQVRAMLDREG